MYIYKINRDGTVAILKKTTEAQQKKQSVSKKELKRLTSQVVPVLA